MRRALVIGLTLLALSLAACSSGLTGGSIPPGGVIRTAALRGRVVVGDDASIPIGGALVRVVPVPSGSSRATSVPHPDPNDPPPTEPPGPKDPPWEVPTGNLDPPGTVRVMTAANGTFQIPRLTAGACLIEVYPEANSDYGMLSYLVTAAPGEELYARLAPLPRKVTLAGMSGIQVEPATMTLSQGAVRPLTIRLLGGAPTPVVPTLISTSSCVTISNKGEIVGLRPGSGQVLVRVGEFAAVVNVRVPG